jgi:glyoxylase I family protein
MDHLALTGLSHVELHVSDLDASTAWYASVVDLTKLRSEPGKFSAMAPAGGGFRIVLTPGRPEDAHGELGHVALAVESLDALKMWADHLTEAGVPHHGIKENKVGQSLDLFDPDGHQIELTYEY